MTIKFGLNSDWEIVSILSLDGSLVCFKKSLILASTLNGLSINILTFILSPF